MKYLLRKWVNLFYFNIELWYGNIMRKQGEKGRKSETRDSVIL